MADMRKIKKLLREEIQNDDWQDSLGEIAGLGQKAIAPLFSFLPLDPQISHRAAVALGKTVAKIAENNLESAKNIIRNYMWHMNEDSGNIGWGIPEAFAETLAASDTLAREYAHILLSYIMDLGHADNYCDNDILRRSCFWAVGRLAQSRPELCSKARPWLLKGLEDPDLTCRGMAAWALSWLPPNLMDGPLIRNALNSTQNENFEIFYDGDMHETSIKTMLKADLDKIMQGAAITVNPE